MNMLYSDSEWESYSDSSDSEDRDTVDSVFGDCAQNILSSLDASIRKIDDFLLLDKVFVHGDYVSSMTDPSRCIGRVTDVSMTVDLESPYGESVKGVDSKKILRFRTFYVGDYVINGSWIGKVAQVLDLVTVVFDDGSKCQINTGDPECLLPLYSSSFVEDAPFPYYPGQRVQMKLSSLYKSARWLCGTWKCHQEEGIVCHVEIESVHVSWIASVMGPCNNLSSAPSPIQDPQNLTLLSCYPYAGWQLGDWCKLPQDYFQNLQMPVQRQNSLGIAPQCFTKMQKFEMKHHAFEPFYVISKTKTKVDILWQDGSYSMGIDTCNLLQVNSVGDNDFWPEQIVLQKTTPEYGHSWSTQRMGIVRNVDAQERTVRIRWVSLEEFHFGVSDQVVDEETVSAYELVEHPDFSYSLGDAVLRRMDEFILVNGRLISDIHDNYGFHCLSYIGNVVGFKDGEIEVKWATGLSSMVKPSEILGVDRFDVTAGTLIHGKEVAEENAGEQSENGKLPCHEDISENHINCSGENCKEDVWNSQILFFPQAAVGFLANVATILFGHCDATSVSGTKTSTPFSDASNSCGDGFEMPPSQVMEKPEFQIMHTLNVLLPSETPRETSPEDQEVGRDMGCCATAVGSSKSEFKIFGIVDDYSDHHFLEGTSKVLGAAQAKRSWLKKVQQEWSILEKNLPDTIYVRVYEERMDLMRASIVGAPGTPYHDALFFFDICFPPDYPHEPPLVHYNSGGLRLNPNLYESGKVCLSLLKTWTGTEDEVWNPQKSTILQVLLSLQGLVLNERPYFNEAGYDKQVGRADGERNSITYNENAFLLSCKSMLYLLRKAPKNFEQLVVEHFSQRAPQILSACKAYMDGIQIGSASGHARLLWERHTGNSTGFKIMLAKLFPVLVSSFREIGADCSQFHDRV